MLIGRDESLATMLKATASSVLDCPFWQITIAVREDAWAALLRSVHNEDPTLLPAVLRIQLHGSTASRPSQGFDFLKTLI